MSSRVCDFLWDDPARLLPQDKHCEVSPPPEASSSRALTTLRLQTHQAKATLPWLELPAATASEDVVRLCDVRGLHDSLQHALQAAGFDALFPIQAAAWDITAGGMSDRHDVCIAAATGSGKTLAFALPVLQRCLEQPSDGGLRGLVVVPTRALAEQVGGPSQPLCFETLLRSFQGRSE